MIAVLCLGLGFTAAYFVLPTSNAAEFTSEQSEVQLYTCGMHPDIISDKPGICPICNMKLTPKRDSGSETGTVKINPATKQNMGLVTTAVAKYNLQKSVSAFGKVVVPDPNHYKVTIKTKGWVEKLFVSEVGEQVFKNQPLFEIYSPEIVTAQKELLVALAKPENQSMQRLAETVRQRLKNWDISDEQIAEIERTGEISRTMIIRSPANGFVQNKNINDGNRVDPNSVLFDIVDISSVWVEAQVYEQDIPHITLKQSGQIVIPGLPGKQIEGKISYISPIIDKNGQLEIRLTIQNGDFLLKPEMYAEVTLGQSDVNSVLAIPRKAVINSGKRQLVYIADSENSYKAREINTGVVGMNDMVAVKSGLAKGDNVVTSGQFLIDSESRLSESISSSEMHNHSASTKTSDDHKSHSQMANSEATENKAKMSIDTEKTDPYDIHTCPMESHSHILNYGPGECADCGMNLVPITETKHAPVFVCPMPSCGTVSQESGVCPKCNMKLIEYKPESYTSHEHSKDSNTSAKQPGKSATKDSTAAVNTDPYNIHTCPMASHSHILNYGPGKCADCGMNLVPISETEHAPVFVCPMPSCGTVSQEPGVCPKCNMKLIEYKPGASND